MWLIRNIYFWVASLVFLLALVLVFWLVFPPLISTYHSNASQLTNLEDQIAATQRYNDSISQLTNKRDQLDALYAQAQTALPASSQSDILTLQLNGLINSLGLSGTTITVPFGQSLSTSASGAAATGTVSPSSQTATGTPTPVVSGGTGSNTFTVTGPMSFGQIQDLLTNLTTFARWNKVQSITITTSNGKTNATISAQVFSRTAATNFTGSGTDLLTQATKLFSSVKSYATTPNATEEGAYGRSDPFAKP